MYKNCSGGITFDAAMMDFQTQRDKNGMPLPLSQQQFSDIRIDGLKPEILGIVPVSIPALLDQGVGR